MTRFGRPSSRNPSGIPLKCMYSPHSVNLNSCSACAYCPINAASPSNATDAARTANRRHDSSSSPVFRVFWFAVFMESLWNACVPVSSSRLAEGAS